MLYFKVMLYFKGSILNPEWIRLLGNRNLKREMLDKFASREPHKYLIFCRNIINDARSEWPASSSCDMYEYHTIFFSLELFNVNL